MKRILYVIIAALVCSVMASGAMAQWTEDFESYDPDLPVPTPPYVPHGGDMGGVVDELFVLSGIGYGPSQGITRVWDEVSAESWRAWSWRAADPTGNDYPIVTLTGRVILANPDDPGVILATSEFTIGAVGHIFVYDARGDSYWAGSRETDSANVQLMMGEEDESNGGFYGKGGFVR